MPVKKKAKSKRKYFVFQGRKIYLDKGVTRAKVTLGALKKLIAAKKKKKTKNKRIK